MGTGRGMMTMLEDWHKAVPWDVVNWCENCPFGAIYVWTKGLFLPCHGIGWMHVPLTYEKGVLKVFQVSVAWGHVWRGLRCSHCCGVGQCRSVR